jgi:hypothetical protein
VRHERRTTDGIATEIAVGRSNGTIRAMTERIDTFLARLERLSIDDLQVLALPPADPDERDGLLDRVDAAAKAAGRLDELDEAADRATAAIVRALSFRGLEPTWFGLNWGRSMARADDRAALVRAVEDAAVAAVVADLLPEDAAALAEPFELVAGMAGAAPAVNPSSGTHRNVVRAAWLLAAVALVIGIGVLLTELVAEIVQQTIGCGNLLHLLC